MQIHALTSTVAIWTIIGTGSMVWSWSEQENATNNDLIPLLVQLVCSVLMWICYWLSLSLETDRRDQKRTGTHDSTLHLYHPVYGSKIRIKRVVAWIVVYMSWHATLTLIEIDHRSAARGSYDQTNRPDTRCKSTLGFMMQYTIWAPLMFVALVNGTIDMWISPELHRTHLTNSKCICGILMVLIDQFTMADSWTTHTMFTYIIYMYVALLFLFGVNIWNHITSDEKCSQLYPHRHLWLHWRGAPGAALRGRARRASRRAHADGHYRLHQGSPDLRLAWQSHGRGRHHVWRPASPRVGAQRCVDGRV